MKKLKFILSCMLGFVMAFAVSFLAGATAPVSAAVGLGAVAFGSLGVIPNGSLAISVMSPNESTIERILPKLWQKKYVPDGNRPRVTQGFIASLASIQGTTKTISFNLLTNQGTVRSIENRLNVTDLFTVTHMTLYLIKAGATTTATDDELAVAQNHTFENTTIFTGANEAVNVGQLYRGVMQVKIDNDVIIDSLDCMRFRRVENAQQGIAVSTAASNNAYSRSGYVGPNFAFAEIDPEITFNGIGKNEVTINLPANLNMGGTGSQNFVMAHFRGLLWQNASKLNQG